MKKKTWFLGLMILTVSLIFAGNPAKRDLDTALQKENARAEEIEFKLEEMRAVLAQEGHTFKIGHNPALQYPQEQLCTLKPELAGPEDILNEGGEYLEGLSYVQALPSAYIGYYTPIKSPGSCGAAWAFAICGVFEGRLKKAGQGNLDLSEQYQLDCNSYGYSCSGGWFTSHNDHKTPKGARAESAYPWVGYKKTCNTTVPIYRQISSWYYVGTSSSVPTVTAIKQAIYDKGSVAAAVYVDSYFMYYLSGCFTRNATGTPNHSILLVGWDDSLCTGGAWRLKNFWGTSWGESGLMWIKYGCQKVGYAANYVNL